MGASPHMTSLQWHTFKN